MEFAVNEWVLDRLLPDSIYVGQVYGFLDALERKGASGGFAAITPTNILIEDLQFFIRQPAGSQPMVTIFMNVKSPFSKANTGADIDLQTTVSSRQF